MERRLKERLIGASVLVMLAVIFIPMMLDDSVPTEHAITQTNIPPRPENGFTSRLIPLPGEPGRKEREVAEPGAGAGTLAAKETGPESRPGGTVIETAPRVESEQQPAQGPGPGQDEPAPDIAASVPAPASSDHERVGTMAWVVQLGSFSSAGNAKTLSDQAKQAGFAAFVEPLSTDSGVVYRVRVGPELRRSDAAALRDRLKRKLNVDGIVISYP